MFLEKGVLKICSKFTGEYGCSPVNLLHIFRTPFTNNSSGWLVLSHSFAVESTVVIRISWSHGKAQNPRGKMILGQFSSYVIVKGYFHNFTKKLIRTDL